MDRGWGSGIAVVGNDDGTTAVSSGIRPANPRGGGERANDRLVGRVLLVEDDRADLLIFRHMLEKLGADHNEIVCVESADQALAEALDQAPDFVVCDWMLGDRTAQSLLRDLRSVCPRAATVVISGNVDDTREALAFEAGAQEVLAKADLSLERLQQVLRRSGERQRTANRERELAVRIASVNRLEQMGTLAAGAIHDLNNLLASASLNLEVLRTPEMLEDVGVSSDAVMGDIGRALDRAGRLCHQLLAYGKHGPPTPAAYGLRPLTEGCVTILPRRLRDRVVLGEERGAESPPPALVDPSTFEQVAYNLLLNAGDAVGEHGRVEVDIVADAQSHFEANHVVVPRPPGAALVVLRVRDDGPGIDSSKLREVFKPFVSSKRGSRGLGLPSVVRAIRLSGGALAVKTGADGTTFFAGFPVDPEHPAAVVAFTPESTSAAVSYGPVLVVDGRAPSPLVEHLRDEGHEVEWCRSETGCSHLLDDLKGRVSVVVLQVLRSAHDTMELAGEVWASHPDVPVVIVDDRREIEQSLDSTVRAEIVRDLEGLKTKIAMLTPLHELH